MWPINFWPGRCAIQWEKESIFQEMLLYQLDSNMEQKGSYLTPHIKIMLKWTVELNVSLISKDSRKKKEEEQCCDLISQNTNGIKHKRKIKSANMTSCKSITCHQKKILRK